MGRSIPVQLGSTLFKSKKAAIAALRAIRDAHKDRQLIVDEDALDVLMGVVAAHPQAAEKIGAGIAGFYVAQAPEYSTRCFYLKRVDGSHTDFSWNEAVTPTTPPKRLHSACRNAIADQKLEFRDAEWRQDDLAPRICAITGKSFTREEAHVDHCPPKTHAKLVEQWLSHTSLAVADILIDHIGDLRATDHLADKDQRVAWKRFHLKHAELRIVSASGNLQQGTRWRA